MFLSIVIPIYNSEEYIDKCIESIISQTDKDFEVILVNDGSTDNSCDIASSKLEDNSIPYKFINKNHQGQSIARNIGLQNAKGQYVLFLDTDDSLMPDMVEVSKRSCNESDILIFGYNRFSPEGKRKRAIKAENSGDNYSLGIDILKRYRKNEVPLWTSNLIYKRSLLKKYKIFYCSNGYAAEDLGFIFKSLLCSKKVRTINTVLSNYCERVDSLTNKVDIKKNISVIDSFEDVLMFIDERGLDLKIEKIIERQFIPEHIMYQILTFINKDNEEEILDILYDKRVRKYLKMAKIFTPRYGLSMVKWMKMAHRSPEKFIKNYIKAIDNK